MLLTSSLFYKAQKASLSSLSTTTIFTKVAPASTAIILLLLTAEVRSETVDVNYRGSVDLKTFECRDTPRSRFIQRVCYDKPQSYMIISLKGTH